MATGNAKRWVELGVPPRLASELAAQITAGVGNVRRLIELGMMPGEAKRVAQVISGTTVGNNRLAETGMIPRWIRELKSQAGGGGPVTTPVVTAGLIARWRTSQIAPQADNTALSGNWVDEINGLAFGGGVPPLYRSAYNGAPGLQFTGTHWLQAALAGTNLRAVLASGSASVFVILEDVQSTTYGTPFAADGNGGGWSIVAGSTAGLYNGITVPFAQSGLAVIGHTSRPKGTYFGYTNASVRRAYVNGTCIPGKAVDPATTGVGANNNLYIGMFVDAFGPTASFGGKFVIREILVYNRDLSPDEAMQNTDYAFDIKGQAYPRTLTNDFILYEGDSLTEGTQSGGGVDTDRGNSYPMQISVAQGRLFGQWTIFALGYSTWDNMVARNSLVTTLKQRVGTKPIVGCFFEFYNQKGTANLASTVTKPALLAYKQLGVSYTVFASTNDYQARGAEKAAYTSNWGDTTALSANLIAAGVDAYYPMHTDANIGVDGAQSNATYFADFVHMTPAGYAIVKTGMKAAYDRLPPH